MLRTWFKSEKSLEKEGMRSFKSFREEEMKTEDFIEELKSGVKHGIDSTSIMVGFKKILDGFKKEEEFLLKEVRDYLNLEHKYEGKLDDLKSFIEQEFSNKMSLDRVNVVVKSFHKFMEVHKDDLIKVDKLVNYERKGKTGGLFKWTFMSDKKLVKKGIKSIKKFRKDEKEYYVLKKQLNDAVLEKQILDVKLHVFKKIFEVLKREHDELMQEVNSYLNLEHRFEVSLLDVKRLLEQQTKLYGSTVQGFSKVLYDYEEFIKQHRNKLYSVKRYSSLEKKAA